jgi:hypothetical protein
MSRSGFRKLGMLAEVLSSEQFDTARVHNGAQARDGTISNDMRRRNGLLESQVGSSI